jgi:hypothetical protein
MIHDRVDSLTKLGHSIAQAACGGARRRTESRKLKVALEIIVAATPPIPVFLPKSAQAIANAWFDLVYLDKRVRKCMKKRARVVPRA